MDKTLQNAVIRRVGRDSLQDVVDHGAAGGEGLMLHRPGAQWQAGRWPDQIKLKEPRRV